MFKPAYMLIEDDFVVSTACELFNYFIPKLAPFLPEPMQVSASDHADAGYPVKGLTTAIVNVKFPLPRTLVDEIEVKAGHLKSDMDGHEDVGSALHWAVKVKGVDESA